MANKVYTEIYPGQIKYLKTYPQRSILTNIRKQIATILKISPREIKYHKTYPTEKLKFSKTDSHTNQIS